MMNCKDVENNLPLYEDNLLSGPEKQAVEQHLKSCSKCAKALDQLQKTGRLVEGLAEVEPPPWFKQKIMSRVHEEAAKKSFTQKLFYPLKIKIPVQIMATIVIAVFAVYIYRSGEEQMKVVLPPTSPAPVMETKKDLFSEQTTKLSEADKTIVKEKGYVPESAQNENIVPQNLPPVSGAYPAGAEGSFPKRDIPRLAESIQPPAGAGGFLQRGDVVKTQELKKSLPPKNERARTMDMAKTMKSEAAVDKHDANFASPPEQQTKQAKVVSPSGVGRERKKEGYVFGASMEQSKAPAKQISIVKAVFSLRVANTKAAVGEVEKIFKKSEAKNINKRISNSAVFLTAEVKAHKMNDIVSQLKTIGRVEGKDMPLNSYGGYILVVIEIVSN